ncbi:hypothetical protein EZS27_024299 [termite gut metagenome]|uniref:Serine protease n=1 Tax=termite gut metagenome TaxID=433724 RepID=A0A5J4R087_9ZZZZ
MGSLIEILREAESSPNPISYLDEKRKKILSSISNYTDRNAISYYSGWLTKPSVDGLDINDSDKNAFMQAVYKMDKSKGLDLILHTPGGGVAATESIVEYLHSIFNGDIRAIVPQLAMSAGTMIALSCQSVVMGKHSNLGPVDPQYRGISCYEALEEFETAKKEVAENSSSLGLWQVIISKYTPTFLISCKHAIEWSEKFTTDWIKNNKKINPQNISNIIKLFVDHESSKSHDRHISKEKCRKAGLNIIDLESDNEFQDLILSLHHCYMLFFDRTNVLKVVDNQLGASYLRFYNKPQG